MNGLGGAMVARWTSTNCSLRLIQRLRVRAPPEMLFVFLRLPFCFFFAAAHGVFYGWLVRMCGEGGLLCLHVDRCIGTWLGLWSMLFACLKCVQDRWRRGRSFVFIASLYITDPSAFKSNYSLSLHSFAALYMIYTQNQNLKPIRQTPTAPLHISFCSSSSFADEVKVWEIRVWADICACDGRVEVFDCSRFLGSIAFVCFFQEGLLVRRLVGFIA